MAFNKGISNTWERKRTRRSIKKKKYFNDFAYINTRETGILTGNGPEFLARFSNYFCS